MNLNDFTLRAFLDLLAAVSLAGGLFFMLVGALGVVRLWDSYSRIHAASKCTTLGLTGMLLAACFHIVDPATVSKAVICICFTFVANPIGSHLLAKAAHHGKAPMLGESVGDELAEDKADPRMCVSDDEIGVWSDRRSQEFDDLHETSHHAPAPRSRGAA